MPGRLHSGVGFPSQHVAMEPDRTFKSVWAAASLRIILFFRWLFLDGMIADLYYYAAV